MASGDSEAGAAGAHRPPVSTPDYSAADRHRPPRGSSRVTVVATGLLIAIACTAALLGGGPPPRQAALLALRRAAGVQAQSVSFGNLLSLAEAADGGDLSEQSALCKKRDVIVDLFDQLIAKLLAEMAREGNATLAAEEAAKEAKNTYLNGLVHIEQRRAIQKDQKELAKHGMLEYQEFKEAFADANATLYRAEPELRARAAALQEDYELILELLAMVRTLHNTKSGATMPSAARARSKALASIAQRARVQAGHDTMAKQLLVATTALEQHKESSAVEQVLLELLRSTEDQWRSLNVTDATLHETARRAQEEKEKWEYRFVERSNEADEPSDDDAERLIHEGALRANETAAREAAEREAAARADAGKDFSREIAILRKLKATVLEHCAAVAGGGAGHGVIRTVGAGAGAGEEAG
jgi:hypothetical protein